MNIPTSKRPRAPSGSSSSSLATSPEAANPPHKASRIAMSSDSSFHTLAASTSSFGSATTVQESGPATGRSLYCNLPPTCHHNPTPIANTNELERHYALYHAHVCEWDKCGCVFTEARFLELHQTECHDPIAALRKERGEKIFQCHIPAPTCGRNFMTPKARRLHLISVHAYPKEYFFAITNKGIGGLLKKWGEGATLYRKEWKPRETRGDVNMKEYRGEDDDKMDDDDSDEDQGQGEEEEDEDEVVYEGYEESKTKGEDEEDESGDLEATPRMLPRTTGIHSPQSSIASSKGSNSRRSRHHNQHPTNDNNTAAPADGVAGLTNSLDSLSLVPNSIRFGRGGKSGAVITNPRGFRGRGRGRGGPGGPVNARGMDLDAPRGTGHRGGGRGGGPGPGTGNAIDGAHTEWVARGRGRGRALPRGRGRGRERGRGL